MQDHPCDNELLKDHCHHVTDLITGNGTSSLAALLRIMKAAHHLGAWNANSTNVEAKDFPAYRKRPKCGSGSRAVI